MEFVWKISSIQNQTLIQSLVHSSLRLVFYHGNFSFNEACQSRDGRWSTSRFAELYTETKYNVVNARSKYLYCLLPDQQRGNESEVLEVCLIGKMRIVSVS